MMAPVYMETAPVWRVVQMRVLKTIIQMHLWMMDRVSSMAASTQAHLIMIRLQQLMMVLVCSTNPVQQTLTMMD